MTSFSYQPPDPQCTRCGGAGKTVREFREAGALFSDGMATERCPCTTPRETVTLTIVAPTRPPIVGELMFHRVTKVVG